MADLVRGKTLFDGRVEYPLPQKAGVADYVFFVPADAYRDQAKAFFNKFYPHHRQFQAPSLEDLINTLHDQVTNKGITQIREVAIVSHGNTLALKMPLLATSTPGMKDLNVYSLACLQKSMREGQFADFAAKRAAVVAKMTTESWVVIRACRFGTCEQAMFGLYAFFGGRAEVYAPKLYQYFGYTVIPDPATAAAAPLGTYRLPSLAESHRHLSRQHLIKPNQTPRRKDDTVTALLDPGAYSAPFELARAPKDQPAPAPFTTLKDALGQGTVTPPLVSAFANAGFTLSATAPIVTAPAGWAISDTLTDTVVASPSASGSRPIQFKVLYSVSLETEDGTGDQVIKAQSRLVNVGAAQPRLATQLFITEAERRLYDGWVFDLSVTQDDQPATDPDVVRYNAIVALLKSNGASGTTLTGGGIDLHQVMADGGAPLQNPPVPTVKLLGQGPSDIYEWSSWSVGGYVIKHEHPNVADDGTRRVHLLRVYRDLTKAELHKWQSQLFAYAGYDLDLPGVELAAYLDRLSIDDLVDIVSYLRAPYRPANAFYIWHAQEAIVRKNEFTAWITARYPGMFDVTGAPIAGLTEPLVYLNEDERQDRNFTSYDLDFIMAWGQAKVTARVPAPFTNDLFLEGKIAPRFGISENDVCGMAGVNVEEDSPNLGPEDLDDLRAHGLNKHLSISVSKDTYQPLEPAKPTGLNRISCPDFRTALETVKTVIGAGAPDELVRTLADQKTPDGSSYLDVFKVIWEFYSSVKDPYDMLRVFGNFEEFLPDLPIPGMGYYDVSKTAIKLVSERIGWRLGVEIIEGISAVDLAITVPLDMMLHIWEEEAIAAKNFLRLGRLTAVRQYLLQLEDLSRRKPIRTEDDAVIDMVTIYTQGLDRAYYQQIYLLDEWSRHQGLPNLQSGEFDSDLHEGVDDGIQAAMDAIPKMLEIVHDATNDLLWTAGFDACKTQALKDMDLLNLDNVHGLVLRVLIRRLRDQLEPGGNK